MTKEAYFDMCEMLGSEPVESEIPVEFSDLYTDVQEAIIIYSRLKDEWDTMGGNYLGKSYAGLLDIFSILNVPVEDHKTIFDLIAMIDRHRSAAIAAKKPKSST